MAAHLHTQQAPLIHASICVGDTLAIHSVSDGWQLSLNHRLYIEGVPVHDAIIGRYQLCDSPHPCLQASVMSVLPLSHTQ